RDKVTAYKKRDASRKFSRGQYNDPHHGVAGVDVDFKSRVPPPLPCMRWFWLFWAFRQHWIVADDEAKSDLGIGILTLRESVLVFVNHVCHSRGSTTQK
ncbi:hypothetical protein, partial [Rhodopirellula europaea]|uniref:hypothetical protein n=1 Tax=Rhodopirellula europaea TaxID=1263866 RepID=UPI001F34480B